MTMTESVEDREKIEHYKQWYGRIGAAYFTVALSVFVVVAIHEGLNLLAGVFSFLIILLVFAFVHDEVEYKRWRENENV